ncbi:hypothetical protein ACRWQN_17360 [Shewanella sp. HL-SH8]|uniref:hypothetical protein n=1 Tax=Shewanella sp. HL-SH8 TaxID=3436242 RepID=UPI003EBA11B4
MVLKLTNVVKHVLLSSTLAGLFTVSVFAQEINVLDQNGKGLENMVVYLLPKHSVSAEGVDNNKKAEVHQVDKQFSPYITVVQKGKDVVFVNEDDITHHIYSALGPKRFSFKLRTEQQQQIINFEQTGHVSMGCNVHDWMSGHLLVVDTPFYGITDKQGRVNFDHIADDEYQVVVWHPQLNMPNNQMSQTRLLVASQAQVVLINVVADFDDIPEQRSLDEFEFLEGY